MTLITNTTTVPPPTTTTATEDLPEKGELEKEKNYSMTIFFILLVVGEAISGSVRCRKSHKCHKTPTFQSLDNIFQKLFKKIKLTNRTSSSTKKNDVKSYGPF